MVGVTCAKDADLSDSESMRYEVLDEKTPESISRSQCIDIAVVVVRTNLGDDGYFAFFWKFCRIVIATFDLRQPESQMDFSFTGCASASVGQSDGWD